MLISLAPCRQSRREPSASPGVQGRVKAPPGPNRHNGRCSRFLIGTGALFAATVPGARARQWGHFEPHAPAKRLDLAGRGSTSRGRCGGQLPESLGVKMHRLCTCWKYIRTSVERQTEREPNSELFRCGGRPGQSTVAVGAGEGRGPAKYKEMYGVRNGRSDVIVPSLSDSAAR
jgi:hypothetical protein